MKYFKFIVGLLLIAFGIFISFGFVGLSLDPESGTTPLICILLVFPLGVLPSIAGILLIFFPNSSLIRRRNKMNKTENLSSNRPVVVMVTQLVLLLFSIPAFLGFFKFAYWLLIGEIRLETLETNFAYIRTACYSIVLGGALLSLHKRNRYSRSFGAIGLFSVVIVQGLTLYEQWPKLKAQKFETYFEQLIAISTFVSISLAISILFLVFIFSQKTKDFCDYSQEGVE